MHHNACLSLPEDLKICMAENGAYFMKVVMMQGFLYCVNNHLQQGDTDEIVAFNYHIAR